jgi:enamine deaminase RidA (YjgF/YER057c/UK114 family)
MTGRTSFGLGIGEQKRLGYPFPVQQGLDHSRTVLRVLREGLSLYAVSLDDRRSRKEKLSKMISHFTPPFIRPPFARYSHGVSVDAGARILFCSGQLGIGPDDVVPADASAQATLCFANIRAVLEEAGMSTVNVIRLNAYVTDRAYLEDYMSARDAFIESADPPPASTLMIVTGFAREIFKVEVEAIAARLGTTQ